MCNMIGDMYSNDSRVPSGLEAEGVTIPGTSSPAKVFLPLRGSNRQSSLRDSAGNRQSSLRDNDGNRQAFLLGSLRNRNVRQYAGRTGNIGKLYIAVLSAALVMSLATALYAQVDPPETPSTAPAPATRPSTIDGVEGWFAVASRPVAPTNVKRPFVIPVREQISEKTFEAMRRKALQARAHGADLLVLDMDTPGGQVKAALDIMRLLSTEVRDIHVVCYVRPWAVSAGAAIALSCDEIVMAPSAVLGDAAPISMGGQLEGVEREKSESVLRKEFNQAALRNGYSPDLAEAMVTIGNEVWLVRNKETGELRFVTRGQTSLEIEVPRGTSTAPSMDNAQWRLVRVIDSADKLLTLGAQEAVAYGFATAVVDPLPDAPFGPLLERYGFTGAPTVMADTKLEKLVGFLTSPAVSGILFFIAVLALYVELNTPGFGLAGAVAIIAFAILFGSRYLTGLAQWWEVAVIVVGLILVVVEVFILPGFGVLGIVGLLMIVAGLLAIAIPNAPGEWPWPTTPLSWEEFGNTVFAMGLAMVAAIITAMVVAQHLPRLPLARRLVLPDAPGFDEAPAMEDSPIHQIAVGDIGIAQSTLRPVGKVRFGQLLLDASSTGEMIQRGSSVRVIRNEGNRLLVEKVAQA